jgi:hypothetical protein
VGHLADTQHDIAIGKHYRDVPPAAYAAGVGRGTHR